MPKFKSEIAFIKDLWAKAASKRPIVEKTVRGVRSVASDAGASLKSEVTSHETAASFMKSFPWKVGAAAVSGAIGTAKVIGKTALDPTVFRGALGRTALFAGAGAVYGYSQTENDYASPDLAMKNAFKGAAVGAIGGALFGGAISAAYGGARAGLGVGKIYKNATPAKRKAIQNIAGKIATPVAIAGGVGVAGIVGVGYLGAKATIAASKFAVKYPGITVPTALAVGGVGYIGWNQLQATTSSPSLEGANMNVNYAEQMNAANMLMSDTISPMGRVGPAPVMLGPSVSRLQASTQGLTQGLHRGRHG